MRGAGTRALSRSFLSALGPGLVSGAADADPTTIATLVVIGSGTVYRLGWLVLLLFPMLAVIQVIATQVGVGSGRHLQAAVAAHQREAPLFYGALATAALLGAGIALRGIPPIRLLFIAGIVGGLATPIGLVMLLGIAANRRLMGKETVGCPLLAAGWAVTIVIALSSAVFIVQPLAQGL